MSAARSLRENDPAGTRFAIVLRHETSDADLAQALEQNPFVTEIELSLVGEQRAEWNSLLRVIATRANLGKVKLHDAGITVYQKCTCRLVRSILQAIQQNAAIQNVELCWLRLPTDISTFVDNASSITSFRLYGHVTASGTRNK